MKRFSEVFSKRFAYRLFFDQKVLLIIYTLEAAIFQPIFAQSFFQQMLIRFSETICHHALVLEEQTRFWEDLILMLGVVVVGGDLQVAMEICRLFGPSKVAVTDDKR